MNNVCTQRQIVAVFVLYLSAFFATDIFAQEDAFREFKATEYPQSEYDVSHRELQHGSVRLRITEVKRTENASKTSFCCRAWFEVLKSGKCIFKRYYDDIDAVGYLFGIFVPAIQPAGPYFAVIKLGDYDGRLFLVHESGEVIDMMGGSYFFSKDKRYLYSEYSSDARGLTIFDLKVGKVVFSSPPDLPSIYQWYEKDEDYFFTECEWPPSNSGVAHEKQGIIYRYDFKEKRIVQETGDDHVIGAKKVKYDFDERQIQYCDCCSARPKEALTGISGSK